MGEQDQCSLLYLRNLQGIQGALFSTQLCGAQWKC